VRFHEGMDLNGLWMKNMWSEVKHGEAIEITVGMSCVASCPSHLGILGSNKVTAKSWKYGKTTG